MAIRFEWDEDKRRKNLAKHGVDFEDTKPVFLDDWMNALYKKQTVGGEQRNLVTGWNGRYTLAITCTIRETSNDEIVRIINARKATKREKQDYRSHIMEAIMRQRKISQAALDYIKQHEDDDDGDIDLSDAPEMIHPTGLLSDLLRSMRTEALCESSGKTFEEFVKPDGKGKNITTK
jgi:hypothetical protein